MPAGRSLNSCKMAFCSMCQKPGQFPVLPAPTMLPSTRHEDSLLRAVQLDCNTTTNRPLLPLGKPLLAPRAIQPRPPPRMSYSSESNLSPGPEYSPAASDEPPRKRGRPTKAETERRRLAAHARGETYPPPRRLRNAKTKLRSPSSSVSPGGVGNGSSGAPFSPASESMHSAVAPIQPPVGSNSSPGTAESRQELGGGDGSADGQHLRMASDPQASTSWPVSPEALPRPSSARPVGHSSTPHTRQLAPTSTSRHSTSGLISVDRLYDRDPDPVAPAANESR